MTFRKENNANIELPDIEGAEYLVMLLHEAGTVIYTGMAATPLSWQELESWQRCTGRVITPWEMFAIKEMSHAYAIEYSHANDSDKDAPYTEIVEDFDRAEVAGKLRNVLLGFNRKSDNPEQEN